MRRAVNFYANDAKVTAISVHDLLAAADHRRIRCAPPRAPNRRRERRSAASRNGGLYNVVPSWLGTRWPARSPRRPTTVSPSRSDCRARPTASTTRFFVGGIYDATAKTVDAFVIEDPFPAIDFTERVRAIRQRQRRIRRRMTLLPRTPPPAVEPRSPPLAYKAAGAFVLGPGRDVRRDRALRRDHDHHRCRTAVSFAAGRVYTVCASRRRDGHVHDRRQSPDPDRTTQPR